jgi:hypothetical protein
VQICSYLSLISKNQFQNHKEGSQANTTMQKFPEKSSGAAAPPASHRTSSVVFVGEDDRRRRRIAELLSLGESLEREREVKNEVDRSSNLYKGH